MIHFYGHSDKDIVPDLRDVPFEEQPDIKREDKLLREIFAPDPVTGKPRSDLHFIYSQDKNPVVAEYIKSVLAQPLDRGASVDNPDDALEMTKTRLESDREYIERIANIIQAG